MTAHHSLLPPGWPRGKGYSHGIEAEGRFVFVAGQVGWNQKGEFESRDFVPQLRQALLNTRAVLASAGAGPEHIARMTWYIADRSEYLARLKEVGEVYREVLGRNYPAMAVIEVKGFIEEGARLEIETTAVIPKT